MKNFLAIDTSSKYMTVLAAKDGKTFVSYVPDCAMRHSMLLMGEIDKVLSEAELSLNDCDFFSAVVGAGSFTGIRIGISTIKGFCLAAGKPSLPVTSFAVAAYNAIDGERPLCLVDALHGNCYVCGFDENKKIAYPPAYISFEEARRLANEERYTFRSAESFSDKGEKIIRSDPAEGLLRAVSALSRDERNFGPLNALYIRKSQAEENSSAGRGGTP